eukprot:6139708-Prymnesium_polylepis.2
MHRGLEPLPCSLDKLTSTWPHHGLSGPAVRLPTARQVRQVLVSLIGPESSAARHRLQVLPSDPPPRSRPFKNLPWFHAPWRSQRRAQQIAHTPSLHSYSRTRANPSSALPASPDASMASRTALSRVQSSSNPSPFPAYTQAP